MRFQINRRDFGLGLLAIGGCGIALPAHAASLPMPVEKTILIVNGKISSRNSDDTAQFDRAMLEKLGMAKIETTTPWYNGLVSFEGVPMTELMKALGATGDKIVATALNDYTTEIPMDDFAKYKPILALKRNGEYMPVKDKGPLFIVYPYDSDQDLKSQKFYSRSAWQVSRLTVK